MRKSIRNMSFLRIAIPSWNAGVEQKQATKVPVEPAVKPNTLTKSELVELFRPELRRGVRQSSDGKS